MAPLIIGRTPPTDKAREGVGEDAGETISNSLEWEFGVLLFELCTLHYPRGRERKDTYTYGTGEKKEQMNTMTACMCAMQSRSFVFYSLP